MVRASNTFTQHGIGVRARTALALLMAAVVALQAALAGAATPAVPRPGQGAPVMTELTAEQRREAEAMVRQARAIAEATARQAVRDPGFVAAVRQLQAQAAATDGQAYRQNAVATPLQLTSGLLFFYGKGQIRKAIFEHFGVDFGVFPPRLNRMTPDMRRNSKPAKRLAIGAIAAGISAAIAYFSPPVVVEEGFRDMSYRQRVQQVASLDFIPESPPSVELDVDDPSDPSSCSATLGLATDGSGMVTEFGRFAERELVWVHPYGSFPNLTELVPAIIEEIKDVLQQTFPEVPLDVPDINDIVVDLAGVGEYTIDDPVGDFIEGLLSTWLDLEDEFYDNFTGWKLSSDGITCAAGLCTARDGPSLARFAGQLRTLPGILRYDFSYRQSLSVKEYFEPTFTGLQDHLTVYYEALEPGGVPTTLPPVGHDGSPAPGHSQVLDPTWFGLTDNCDPRPHLEWNLPAFLELGVHELPVAATDRSGNRVETTVTVVVQDSIPPDVLPPEDVGITAPAGAATVPFTGTDAAGDPIGCLTWRCEGDPPGYQLYPPVSFDFASLEPIIGCTVSNSLYPTPEPCAGADLAVGEHNTVTWTLTDTSGNTSTVAQLAVVRAAGTNRPPSVSGGSFTVPADVTVEVPLSARDPDLDPLSFRVTVLPRHGDLDAQAEAIFQTRFATSGVVRRATSFARLTGQGGNPSDVLVVGDGPGHALLVFDVIGDPYLYTMFDLGDVAPDAIQVYDGPRTGGASSVEAALGHLWIADFTDEGDGDPVVNALYRLKHHGGTSYTLEHVADLPLPAGTRGRDFRIEAHDLAGPDQSLDITVFVTGTPPLLSDSPPTFDPDNRRLGFSLASTDSGSTWAVTVTDPGTPASATSTTFDPYHGCGTGSTTTVEGFWSTSPPWGELRLDGTTYPLTQYLQDPDGSGPALPVLQNPTAVGLDGSCGDVLVLEAQDLKLEAFSRSGGTLQRVQSWRWPLRLTHFITIRGIEEIPISGPGQPQFWVLDDEGLYRFDLAGRLVAFVSFLPGGAVNTLPPPNGTAWWDIATDGAGHVFLLANVLNHSGSSTPGAIRLQVAPGVGNVTDNGRFPVFGVAADSYWAIAADDADLFATGTGGLQRCSNDLSTCSQVLSSSPYRDLEIRTGTGEIFATEIDGATQRVVRLDRNDGHAIAAFGQGRLDFNAGGTVAGDDLSGVPYGRLAYDAGSDRLYVSDNPPDPANPGQRIPRVVVFSGDGTWLEDIVPDASPNLFGTWLQPGDFGTVSDIAVGPGRTYVAEDAPLKRLHVFDVATFYRVPCPDPTVECRTVTYIPDPGYTGPDGFDYAAVDPFGATSPDGHIALDLVHDTTPPTLVCPADLAVEARDPGGVTLTDPLEEEPDADLRDFFTRTATDDVDLPDPVVSRDGGRSFPVGPTVVTFTATDGAGNTTSCQATLTVTDTVPPEFRDADGNALQELDPVVVEATAPRTPFSPPVPEVHDVGGLASVVHDGPATYPVGDTRITWTATDLAGNVATATQIVRVQDTTPPEFILPLPPDDTFVQTPAVSGWANPLEHEAQKATDAVGVEDLSCDPALGDPVPVGLIAVTCVAYDAAGNAGRRTFSVDVQDPDPDGDGLGNLVDTEPTTPSRLFGDAAHGGITSGSVVGGDHPLLVTDGPAERLGVSVVVGGRTGPRPSEVTFCQGHLRAWLAFTEVTIEPDLVIPDPETEVNDGLLATCLADGFEATSEQGNIPFAFTLPHGPAVVRGTVDVGETARLEGWAFEVPTRSAGPVTLALPDGREITVRPGLSIDLTELVMGPSADLAVTGAAEPSTVSPGGPVAVTFDVAGGGPSTASETVLAIGLPPGLTDPLTTGCAEDPAGVPTCTLGEVPAGTVTRVRLRARVAAHPPAPLVVTGTVHARTFDPDPSNDTAAVDLGPGSSDPPEAEARFEPAVIPFLGGATSLRVSLATPADSAGSLGQVTLDARLPEGLLVAAPAGATSSCSGTLTAVPGTAAITLAGATLVPDRPCTVTVNVTVDPDRATVGEHTARAVPSAAASGAGTVAEAVVAITPVRTFTGPTATGRGDATVTFSGGGPGCTFSRVAWVDPAAAGASELWFPDGLLSLATTGCSPGEALELVLTPPTPPEPGVAYRAWGPTAGDPAPHWYRVPSVVAGGTLRVTLSDGAAGDSDLTADGRLVALGGVPAAQQAERIPVLGPLGTGLLALLLALAGWAVIVRRTLP